MENGTQVQHLIKKVQTNTNNRNTSNIQGKIHGARRDELDT